MKPTMRSCLVGPFRLLWSLMKYWQILAFLLLAGAAFWLYRGCVREDVPLTIEHDRSIDVSPEEIRAIRDIGEWEFLSVNTEELVELNEAALLGDKELVRIYTGTLRLGINLSHSGDHWFEARGDTAILRLPAVGLLDPDFIDEARTRSFYEKGHWDAEARQKLYEKARKAMLRRCLTRQNLEQAEQNAREQFEKIFRSLGFGTVEITFEPLKK